MRKREKSFEHKNKLKFSENSKSCSSSLPNKTFSNLKLWNIFLKHVKQKKRYEIFKMAEITYDIASKLNVKLIVDVGSGLGHLTRVLAYGFQFTVFAIESNHELIQQARLFFKSSDCSKIKILKLNNNIL